MIQTTTSTVSNSTIQSTIVKESTEPMVNTIISVVQCFQMWLHLVNNTQSAIKDGWYFHKRINVVFVVIVSMDVVFLNLIGWVGLSIRVNNKLLIAFMINGRRMGWSGIIIYGLLLMLMPFPGDWMREANISLTIILKPLRNKLLLRVFLLCLLTAIWQLPSIVLFNQRAANIVFQWSCNDLLIIIFN